MNKVIAYKILRQIIKESILRELGENNITPTVPLLKKWFNELNEKYFNNTLPECRLEVEPMNRSLWGHFASQGRCYYTKSRKWCKPFDPSYCHIGISSYYDGTERNLKNVLLHEMVHYYIHMTLSYRPTRQHGNEFMNEAYRVNNIAKKLGEPYEVTPTNDYVENTVSQVGLEKFGDKITGEYIIGIDESRNRYGLPVYWLFRTEEKYIPTINAAYTKDKIEYYKLYTNNPKFAIGTSVCRRRISGWNFSTKDGLLKHLKELYGDDIRIEPLQIGDNANKKISGKAYVLGVLTDNNETYYWAFKTESKYKEVLKARYAVSYYLDFFNVKNYDANFDLLPICRTKVNGKISGSGRSFEIAIEKLKSKYNCNFTIDE